MCTQLLLDVSACRVTQRSEVPAAPPALIPHRLRSMKVVLKGAAQSSSYGSHLTALRTCKLRQHFLVSEDCFLGKAKTSYLAWIDIRLAEQE
jgi:hypothetical protein